MNIFNIFDDYEKKYHNWLQDKNVKSWYHPNQITPGLLGKEQRTMHPTEGVVTGNRIGGIFGQGGTADKALDYAGGKAADYFKGEKVWTPDAPTNLSRTGVHSSKSMEHADKIGDVMVGTIEKTKEGVENILDWAFPNAPFMKDKLNKEEKTKLESMVKSGNIDHGFVQALKAKANDPKEGPANENDVAGLEKFMGISKEDAMKNWKDKGGFEGLMSNPAFTLGLALMQSSAQGKSIGEDAMNNFIKAAGISEHYKDRMDARTKVLGPPTQDERDLAAGALQSIGISGPGWGTKGWDMVKLWGKDNTAAYNAGLNKIIIKSKEIIKKKYKGETHQITEQDYIDAFNELKKSGKLGSIENIFGVGIKDMENQKTSGKSKVQQWVENIFGVNNIFTRAEGGPVNAGQPYLVGEKGPEIVVPNQNATVLSNDDSQVMSMLLASNPQLQNISRARAEGILRSRFPDYFA